MLLLAFDYYVFKNYDSVNDNVGQVEDRLVDMSNMNCVDRSQNGTLRCCADVADGCAEDKRTLCGNNADKEKSSHTSWLYQCMISECSATFERLIDLRMHFVAIHQPGRLVTYYSY